LLDSEALARIQTALLLVVILVASVSGISVYYIFNKESTAEPTWTPTPTLSITTSPNPSLTTSSSPTSMITLRPSPSSTYTTPPQSIEPIRVGVCADLDNSLGLGVWRGAILAAEQVNAAGGVLGRNIKIVAEDDDSENSPADATFAENALVKLITVDKADFVIANAGDTLAQNYQKKCAEFNKIIFGTRSSLDKLTQNVLDNYNQSKYFFRLWTTNITVGAAGMIGDILAVTRYTSFTKIAFIAQDSTSGRYVLTLLNSSLPQYGIKNVYTVLVPSSTTDFTSYFAAAEAAGAEIIYPIIYNSGAISFVKEWYNRQSPTVVWGQLPNAQNNNFWDLTSGACQYVSFTGTPILAGYPLTNQTVPTREAYLKRWGEDIPSGNAAAAYDGVRFILTDAIRRAGTIETEAVIKTLENVEVETSLARRFVFTSSHDLMVGDYTPNNPAENYVVLAVFQWQAGQKQVIVNPQKLMIETGATYQLPPWKGPWSK
jgi:branched-chain amino acid transport system substrate-binding protein